MVRRFVLIAILMFVFLMACGKQSNINVVKNGAMPGHESTTVGKAFEGSFDNCVWDTVESEKGKKIVVFKGNISKKTHDSFVNNLLAQLDQADNSLDKIESRIKLFYFSITKITGRNPERFSRFIDVTGTAYFDRTNQELGCSGIVWPGGTLNYPMPECPSKETTEIYLKKTIQEGLRLTWEAGTPVEVKWSVNLDRKSFTLDKMSSSAWEGIQFENILNVIYK